MKQLVVRNKRDKFIIVSVDALGDEQVSTLLELIQRPVGKTTMVLGGRRTVTAGELPGIGPVVVKHFTRGGLFGKCVSRWYLRVGGVRSRIEFDRMKQARELGVHVPEPVAYVWQGGLFYRTWLISRTVENYSTLAELSLRDPGRCEERIEEVVRQIELLIRNGIYHIDLHPGNVLVTERDEVFIIDFDKARRFTGSPNALRDKYLCRWRRAVIKHELPELLCERLCAGLRRNFTALAAAESSQ